MKKIFLIAIAWAAAMSMAAQPVAACVLDSLKARIAPDRRTAIWEVSATTQQGDLVIYGTVGLEEQKQAIGQELRSKGITQFQNNVIVLEDEIAQEQRWGLIKLSIATLRCEGRHAAEMATQGIMGMPVKVIQFAGEWARVQTPDHYISFCPRSSIAFKSATQMAAWRGARRYIVTTYGSQLVAAPASDETVSDLVLGNILEFKGKKGGWLQLATPDGRLGWVEEKDVEELAKWAQQEFNPGLIEKTARRMMGSSYLWGGTSTKVTDCSGLTKVSYFANGIILQRDASQQALTGQKMAGDELERCQQGDLLFFGDHATGRVTHVGLYLHDGQYIHCSGQVKINSLKKGDALYLYDALSASRINGMVGTAGIAWVRAHPWYF